VLLCAWKWIGADVTAVPRDHRIQVSRRWLQIEGMGARGDAKVAKMPYDRGDERAVTSANLDDLDVAIRHQSNAFDDAFGNPVVVHWGG
jgi:hypothetical protein